MTFPHPLPCFFTPTFDTIEAQASYGIGLQVGQQLSESGLEGLLPEALVAGIAD
ncbi:hypothetical protein MJI37_34500, partial [Salmonella enterica subsp. enterica serovar Cerro]|nr:hypothetical protein [Salmonella enterica subsp. enterica serovar Cerro]